jgi:hypothetical protein
LALIIFQVGYHFCLGPVSDHDLPTYSLPHTWDNRCTSPCWTYGLRWSPTNFLPRMASHCHLDHLCLLSSENYRCEYLLPQVPDSLTQGFLDLWIWSSVKKLW